VIETPIQAAYWYLADQINKLRPRRCPECGRMFLGGKDKFCPPEEGKTISKCKTRFNVQRFRLKKKRRRKS